MRIYLSGPIHGKSDEECKGWREKATQLLEGHECYNPILEDFRGREYENREEIVRRDLQEIQASDVLLVNAETPGWGTAMEIFYAQEVAHTHLVIAFGVDKMQASPWLVAHCDDVFATLEEACAFLRSL